MKTINLHTYQIELLINSMDKVINKSLISKIELAYPGGDASEVFQLRLSEEEVDILLDCLSESMMSDGITDNGELNSLGLRFEDIIDALTKE